MEKTVVANDSAAPRSAQAPLKRPAPGLALVEASAPAARAQKLFHEAQAAALDHVRLLGGAVARVRDLSEAVLDGGDLYDPGVREFARQMAETMRWKGKSLQALAAREADRSHLLARAGSR